MLILDPRPAVYIIKSTSFYYILYYLRERRRYCVARRPSVTLSRYVCVSAALVSAAKIMRCIQCSLVDSVLKYGLNYVGLCLQKTFYLSLHDESKNKAQTLMSISSPNIDRFLKFFNRYTQQEIFNHTAVTIYLHRYGTL